MRAQVMPLGVINIRTREETPFVLVIDQATPLPPQHQVDYWARSSGARAVWVVEGTLDVGTPLVLTDTQMDKLTRLLQGGTA